MNASSLFDMICSNKSQLTTLAGNTNWIESVTVSNLLCTLGQIGLTISYYLFERKETRKLRKMTMEHLYKTSITPQSH